MAKKEFKVGETFQCGVVKLKVVQADIDSRDDCKKCFFREMCKGTFDIKVIVGNCCSYLRQDNNNVYFEKVED